MNNTDFIPVRTICYGIRKGYFEQPWVDGLPYRVYAIETAYSRGGADYLAYYQLPKEEFWQESWNLPDIEQGSSRLLCSQLADEKKTEFTYDEVKQGWIYPLKTITCPSCGTSFPYDENGIPEGATYELTCPECETLLKRKTGKP